MMIVGCLRCCFWKGRRQASVGIPFCAGVKAIAGRLPGSIRSKLPGLIGPRKLRDAGIIRNRLKIDAAVANAQAFLAVQDAFGSFDEYVWRFVGGRPIVNRWKRGSEIPATSRQSDQLSKDLKGRGFRFVGSTIVYAFMQAVGMVNDHTAQCFLAVRRSAVRGDSRRVR
jgi:methyladenine glycosylase